MAKRTRISNYHNAREVAEFLNATERAVSQIERIPAIAQGLKDLAAADAKLLAAAKAKADAAAKAAQDLTGAQASLADAQANAADDTVS